MSNPDSPGAIDGAQHSQSPTRTGVENSMRLEFRNCWSVLLTRKPLYFPFAFQSPTSASLDTFVVTMRLFARFFAVARFFVEILLGSGRDDPSFLAQG